MIANTDKIADQGLLGLLALASTNQVSFCPCGSRYFGYFKDDSDYDFFAANTVMGKAWLAANSFVECKRNRPYRDVNSVSFWKRGRVCVILVKSVSSRLKLQEHIRANKLRPPKGDTDWWNALYRKLCPETFSRK